MNWGTLVTGIAMLAFSSLPFIPYAESALYCIAGFSIRSIKAAGIAAVYSAVITSCYIG